MARELVIDDDTSIREVMCLAIALIARQHSDLTLLDMKMPAHDGWGFAGRYRCRSAGGGERGGGSSRLCRPAMTRAWLDGARGYARAVVRRGLRTEREMRACAAPGWPL